MDNFVIGTIQENIKLLNYDVQSINSNIPKSIDDLSDVNITSTPADGEVLTYNSAIEKFEPQAQSGGGDHTLQGYLKSEAPLYVDTTNDKVGINEASPTVDFQVGTTMYVNDTTERVGINEASPTVDFQVGNTMYVDTTVNNRVGINEASPAVDFQVGTTMYVDTTVNNRVGIGITDPKQKLDVDSIIQITAPNATTSASLYFNQLSTTASQDLAEITSGLIGTNSGDLQFWVADGGTKTQKITINDKGAIGIGSPPNYGTEGQVLTAGIPGNPVSWKSGVDDARSLIGGGFEILVKADATGTVPILYSTTGLRGVREDVHVYYAEEAGGLIGGTATRPYKITVVDDGTVPRLHSDAGNSGPNNVHVYYADSAGTSDDRIKFNEKPINTTRSIEILRALKFQSYDKLKESYGERVYTPETTYKDFGLISQEIAEMAQNGFPELVNVSHNVGALYAVRYDAIFSIVATATQDILSRLEALESKINT